MVRNGEQLIKPSLRRALTDGERAAPWSCCPVVLTASTRLCGGYLHVVRNYPTWAIIKACEQVRAGQAGLNTSFCPSEPEFCELVRKLVAPYALQLRKTEALLVAKPPNAEAPREAAQPAPQIRKPDTGYAKRAVIDLILKLWVLGCNNPSAAEPASAKERALALMVQYNILPTDLGPAPTVFELDPETWNN